MSDLVIKGDDFAIKIEQSNGDVILAVDNSWSHSFDNCRSAKINEQQADEIIAHLQKVFNKPVSAK